MNIVCIGAHPDDCECFAGGSAILWARAGHRVLFVSMTNGDIGHFQQAGGMLAQRRIAETRLSAERGGVHDLVLGYHDGELAPSLEARREVVRIIRQWEADVVLTHRSNDYHPDHRYTSILVQDAAFMVTVPHFCPEVPRLERNPVFLYMVDGFQRPVPFRADVGVDVTEVMETKLHMLDAMESQVYEWLPWLQGRLDEVPSNADERREWLRTAWDGFFSQHTEIARPALERWYGAKRARKVRYAEAFEICEYGHQPNEDEIRRLFPFFS
ncbi:MAG: PIG-L family deacetylase [Candidatus Hydrogenedentes bacterium]|nr:PIG-L family deacetylase [Candidatus Hydrogenedentota bacterium]